ncbi:hypothetical protein T01_9806 [Trichinella spiralis]|uniref:Uncharacterized protein n=1 Tax=Trichinella spiralis TaxID=6334 RepID=A0A0V1B4C7_TRISP|nr:hypothetical protein T01_9806 [Trichinella spiralis]
MKQKLKKFGSLTPSVSSITKRQLLKTNYESYRDKQHFPQPMYRITDCSTTMLKSHRYIHMSGSQPPLMDTH